MVSPGTRRFRRESSGRGAGAPDDWPRRGTTRGTSVVVAEEIQSLRLTVRTGRDGGGECVFGGKCGASALAGLGLPGGRPSFFRRSPGPRRTKARRNAAGGSAWTNPHAARAGVPCTRFSEGKTAGSPLVLPLARFERSHRDLFGGRPVRDDLPRHRPRNGLDRFDARLFVDRPSPGSAWIRSFRRRGTWPTSVGPPPAAEWIHAMAHTRGHTRCCACPCRSHRVDPTSGSKAPPPLPRARLEVGKRWRGRLHLAGSASGHHRGTWSRH